MKIERNIYVKFNEEKAVSEIQILINKKMFSHHELLMSFISVVSSHCGLWLDCTIALLLSKMYRYWSNFSQS